MRSRLDPGIYIPTPRWRAELHDVLERARAVRAERRRRVERACEIMTQPGPEDGAASAARDKLREPPPLDAAQEQRFLAAAMAARRT